MYSWTLHILFILYCYSYRAQLLGVNRITFHYMLYSMCTTAYVTNKPRESWEITSQIYKPVWIYGQNAWWWKQVFIFTAHFCDACDVTSIDSCGAAVFGWLGGFDGGFFCFQEAWHGKKRLEDHWPKWRSLVCKQKLEHPNGMQLTWRRRANCTRRAYRAPSQIHNTVMPNGMAYDSDRPFFIYSWGPLLFPLDGNALSIYFL